MKDTVVIIPCFNEESRLDRGAFIEWAQQGPVQLLFVNDGSQDGTQNLLNDMVSRGGGSISVLRLAQNQGKAEAVRQGLKKAIDEGATTVGYIDADLSTPVAEAQRVLNKMNGRGAQVGMGARVVLLGTKVLRPPLRRYLGRLFAMLASVALKAQVYDTQCGCKFFKVSPLFKASLQEPFLSRWAFDVELLQRLMFGYKGQKGLTLEQFLEVPLQEWKEVSGSRLKSSHMLKAGLDLVRLILGVGVSK